MSQIDNTLNERGQRYGEFTGHAEITQGLKDVMFATDNWAGLADDQKEALEMVAHKIGRILNGDPNYIDSWHDIIGYVRLVEQRLEKEQNKPSNSIGSSDLTSNNDVKTVLAELQRYGIHIVFAEEA